MKPSNLIDISKRKNEAYVKLVDRRHKFYVPSNVMKSTADDRKIALDYDTRLEQQAYDDLCDQYEVYMEQFRQNAH